MTTCLVSQFCTELGPAQPSLFNFLSISFLNIYCFLGNQNIVFDSLNNNLKTSYLFCYSSLEIDRLVILLQVKKV